MTLAIELAGCFTAGLALGTLATARLATTLLARLDPAERLAFARGVNARARKRT